MMKQEDFPEIRSYSAYVGDTEIIIETGRYAMQAGGAVTVRVGDTMLFCVATMNQSPREGMNFFPLSVDYEEKLYAAGRIPGSWGRREGRPSDRAILISRVIDRTLRPLFPKGMRNDVQIVLTSLAHDQENHVDMPGIIAASTAIMISDIPWGGPVAGVRIGLIDGELVVNPTLSQMENSDLDLRVSGTKDALNMVECGANEVDEATMVRAMKLAHESIQPVLELQERIAAEIGKEKSGYTSVALSDSLVDEVRERVLPEIKRIVVEDTERDTRKEAIAALEETVVAEYEAKNAALQESDPEAALTSAGDVREAIDKVYAEEMRRRILEDGIRPDGRDTTTIRPLRAEVGLVPRVHGTGMFQRGQTQVLTIATLGTPRDSQTLDGLDPEESKRYLHHYNFP
ncbi:MAG: polyribonucleotide nucleotidyltransferase, partial [Anaerolineae bacterium]|nr:polyribonucleotide nucleotidyltransferase [Anaerolineae bacterium]